MDCNTIKEYFLSRLDAIGLVFNLIGTLFIAFYTKKDPNEWVPGEGKCAGKKWHALLIKHPCWLKFGLILIIVGFFLVLIDSLLK